MAHSDSSKIICYVTTSDPTSVIDNHLIDKNINISKWKMYHAYLPFPASFLCHFLKTALQVTGSALSRTQMSEIQSSTLNYSLFQEGMMHFMGVYY